MRIYFYNCCLPAISLIVLLGCGPKEPVQLHISSSSAVSKEVTEPSSDSSPETGDQVGGLAPDVGSSDWQPGPPLNCEPTTLLKDVKPKDCKQGREFLSPPGAWNTPCWWAAGEAAGGVPDRGGCLHERFHSTSSIAPRFRSSADCRPPGAR